jgi:hypothetical protein
MISKEELAKSELSHSETMSIAPLEEEVDIKVEEESDEIQKIRVIRKPSGKVETVTIKRLRSPEIPLLAQITAKPPGLTSPKLSLISGVSVEIKLHALSRLSYPLQHSVVAFIHKLNVVTQLLLPLFTGFIYSYPRIRLQPVNLTLQTDMKTYTSKHLLTLTQIILKLPMIPEGVEVKEKFQTLAPIEVALQKEVKVDVKTELLENIKASMVKGWGLLELLFPEEREKLRNFITSATEYVGEPIIVILPKSALHVWYLFWVICRELYREARGSHPEPVILFKLKSEPSTKSKTNCAQRLEYWLKLYRSFSGKLVILDDECIEDEHVKELFERRLKETFSQGLGFIIVLARDIHETEELIKELCKPYIPKVFSIERVPDEGFLLEHLSKTMSSLFGLPVRLERLSKLDAVVAEVDRKYRDFINELLLSDYIAYVKKDVGVRESEDHIALKILAIKVLTEEHGLRPENICCTCPINENAVPDIYVENRGLVVECEAMFEVAPTPLIKIFESMRKYLGLNPSKPINEIWVIIRNWPALIHLGDLAWIENILREEFKQNKRNVNVRFFVPDIHRKTIRALDDVIKYAFSIPVPGGGMSPRA